MNELKETDIPVPVGDFILNHPAIKAVMTENGGYYYFGDVCTLLKQYAEKERNIAVDLLDECRLQLEYLSNKFGETGTGNNLLSRINTFLDSINK